MKKIKNKNKGKQQSEIHSQTVEMFVYFEGHESDHRAFRASFTINEVTESVNLYEEILKDCPEFRRLQYEYICEKSLMSKPELPFYFSLMTYMCSDETIQKEILKYPDGSWAIIGKVDYNDQAVQKFQFMDPVEFQKHLDNDYSFVPFTGQVSGVSIDEDGVIFTDLKESLFLSSLTELIQISGDSYCHLSNDELLRYFPIPMVNREWISETLGKFLELGIIDILTYEVDGSIWYRAIIPKHPGSRVFFVSEQKIPA